MLLLKWICIYCIYTYYISVSHIIICIAVDYIENDNLHFYIEKEAIIFVNMMLPSHA